MATRVSDVFLQMRWIVEDGRSINFMTDSWIANLFLARWPTFILMEIPDSIFIFDLLVSNGTQ